MPSSPRDQHDDRDPHGDGDQSCDVPDVIKQLKFNKPPGDHDDLGYAVNNYLIHDDVIHYYWDAVNHPNDTVHDGHWVDHDKLNHGCAVNDDHYHEHRYADFVVVYHYYGDRPVFAK